MSKPDVPHLLAVEPAAFLLTCIHQYRGDSRPHGWPYQRAAYVNLWSDILIGCARIMRQKELP